jgi:hypothetical protein
MFARTTKDCVHTTEPLKLNKHVVPDIIKDEFNRDFFNIKCSEHFEKNCLKDKEGNNLDHVVFVNAETKEKYHEHICNLNKYERT